MDNQYNQTEVAYETAPKEKNVKRGMPDGNKQFGHNKMPQDSKPASKRYVKQVMEKHERIMHSGHGRHHEHR